jgi:hypothetical protein
LIESDIHRCANTDGTRRESKDMGKDDAAHPSFSADETRTLAAVLDEIIPPSSDGRLPGAGQLGLAGYIDTALRKTPELRSVIASGLAEIEALARERTAPDFATLSRADKVNVLAQQGFVFPLMLQAYAAYYQQPRVLAALGLEARPPHPTGYQMEPNDLSLLDPVRRRPRLYREC